MNQPAQKARERAMLATLLKLRPDLFSPPVTVTADERPDSILTTNNRNKIGIEVTELYRAEGTYEGRPLQEQENLQRQIVAEAQRLFEQAQATPLHVWVTFNFTATFNKAKDNFQQIEQAIADEIATHINHETLSEYMSIPSKIEQVADIGVMEAKKASWTITQSGTFLPITNEKQLAKLRKVISRKSSTRTTCTPALTEAWLLIVSDFAMSSAFDYDDIDMSSLVFASTFDRIFLLRFNDVVELQNERY
ncbi:MAG TPA: hypothetical protein VLL52_12535 [Anaerolineae bacterium]|nr:hypothetical protein [Anaerolineae bacterium]